MNYSFDEAMKEMDFLVEKMQLVLPTESYRIQCIWEAVKAEYDRILDVGLDSAYNLYGEHKFFNEGTIHDFMSTRVFKALDHHKE